MAKLIYDEAKNGFSLLEDTPAVAGMEQVAGAIAGGNSFLAKIANFEVAELPVGGVGMGLAVSGLVDLLIGSVEGMTGKRLPMWVAKGLAAAAVVKWGKRYLSPAGAYWTAGILTVDAIESLYDVRGTFRGLGSKMVSGVDGAIGNDAAADEVELVGAEVPDVKLPPELLGVGASPAEGAKRGLY
jgi:hypothetical protein